MPTLLDRIQRFLWWCAAADAKRLTTPPALRIDGIKFSTIGAMVCVLTLSATVGWADTAAMMLGDGPWRIPEAVAVGVFMGALVFCFERVLIVSIPARITPWGKWAAFSWRAMIGTFTAAMVSLPVVLLFFQSETLYQLDVDKLRLTAEARGQIDRTFDLGTTLTGLEKIEAALAANRVQRDQLPNDVQDLDLSARACARDYVALDRTLQPQIAQAVVRRANLQMEVPASRDTTALESRIAQLSTEIEHWNLRLAAKQRTCGFLQRQFEVARNKYFSELDSERNLLVAQGAQDQTILAQNQHAAAAAYVTADAAVKQRVAPGLWARLNALYELARDDVFKRMMIIALYMFFAMIDLGPIAAKLLSRATYEKSQAADEESADARMKAEVFEAQVQGELRVAKARAELEGFLRFSRDTQVFAETARAQARLDARKAELLEPFELAKAAVQAFDDTQSKIDRLIEQYDGDANAFENIERLRQVLRAAMMRAGSDLTDGPAPQAERELDDDLQFQKAAGTA